MTDPAPKFKVGELVRYNNRNMDNMHGIREVYKIEATTNGFRYLLQNPQTRLGGGWFCETELCHTSTMTSTMTSTTPAQTKAEFKMGDKVRVKGCAQTFTITTICYGGERVSPCNGVYLELYTKEHQIADIDKKLADVMTTVADLMEQKKKVTSSD